MNSTGSACCSAAGWRGARWLSAGRTAGRRRAASSHRSWTIRSSRSCRSSARGGREDDRIRALALFAAARVAEQKQDYPRALRNYQRAFRFDPDAVPALREIVPLAFNLDRQAEAVRYALIMAEHEPADPVLLRAAGHLSDRRRRYRTRAQALRKGAGAVSASRREALGQRRAAVDGNGPAVFRRQAIRPGGPLLRRSLQGAGKSQGVRPRRRRCRRRC